MIMSSSAENSAEFGIKTKKARFTFGGATSHDIDGGILEPDDPDFKKKRKKLNKGILPYRINHVSCFLSLILRSRYPMRQPS